MTFQPGQSGNPKGRPLHTRNLLTEKVIRTLLKDFRRHGLEAVQRCREDNPAAYLSILARIVPSEVRMSGAMLTADVTGSFSHHLQDFSQRYAEARRVEVKDVTPALPAPIEGEVVEVKG